MHAAALAANERGQCIHISRLQLRQLPVLENEPRNFVIRCQSFQHIHRRRNLFSLPIFHRHRESELVEQHIPKLLRRIDVELHAATLINVPRLGCGLALQLHRHLLQRRRINLHSRVFHARQHGHERPIDLLVHRRQSLVVDFFAKRGRQPARYIRRFGQVAA